MYTLKLLHSRDTQIHFLNDGIDSGIYDSSEVQKQIPTQTEENIKRFTDRALAVFEKEPSEMKNFLTTLNQVKESIFGDPILFREFLNRAYEKHTEDVALLQWSERSKKISDFSNFITDIMLGVADVQQIPRLSLAIRTQKLALETATEQKKLIARMWLHWLKTEIA